MFKRIKVIEAVLLLLLFGVMVNVFVINLSSRVPTNNPLVSNKSNKHFVYITDEGTSYNALEFEQALLESIDDHVVLEVYKVESQADDISQAFRTATLMGVDGIISRLQSNDLALDSIKNAHDQGIATVLIGNDSPGSLRDVYIGANKFELGQAAANQLKNLNDDEPILVLMSADYAKTGGTSSNSFLNGLNEGLSGVGQTHPIKVANTSDQRVELILEPYLFNKDVRTVVCTDPIDTERVINLLIEFNLVSEFFVIGHGLQPSVLDALDKGIIKASLSIDHGLMGQLAYQALKDVTSDTSHSSYQTIDIIVREGQE